VLAVAVGLLFSLGVWLIVSEVESRRRLEVEVGLVRDGGRAREEDLVQRVLRMAREQKRCLGDNSRFAVRLRLAGIGIGTGAYWGARRLGRRPSRCSRLRRQVSRGRSNPPRGGPHGGLHIRRASRASRPGETQ
jgi:hypothetical protein